MLRGSGNEGAGDALANLDNNDNLTHAIDYRQIYASLITEWFGHSQELVSNIFSQNFDPLGIFSN